MLQKLKRCLAAPPFRRKNLQYLALVIDGTPELMRLPIDLHEHLVQVGAQPGRDFLGRCKTRRH